jgi:hypothetical protein
MTVFGTLFLLVWLFRFFLTKLTLAYIVWRLVIDGLAGKEFNRVWQEIVAFSAVVRFF